MVGKQLADILLVFIVKKTMQLTSKMLKNNPTQAKEHGVLGVKRRRVFNGKSTEKTNGKETQIRQKMSDL